MVEKKTYKCHTLWTNFFFFKTQLKCKLLQHTLRPYTYEHLRKTRTVYIEIDEVITGVSLSTFKSRKLLSLLGVTYFS